LSLNGGSVSQGILLLSAYSAGLAIPFLVASIQIGLVTTVIRRYGKLMRYVEIGMGVVLIIVGLMLFMGRFETLASLGSFFGIYDEVVIGRLILIVIAVLAVLGLIPAYIASRKGRHFLDWWFFGAALFPIALPMALLIKSQPEQAAPTRSFAEGAGEEPIIGPEHPA
jgi:hypothetical protein